MELAVYLTDPAGLEHLEEALQPLAMDGIPGFISSVLSLGQYGLEEYIANGMATTFLGESPIPLELGRLYFGQEFCEFLIPTPEEVVQAFFTACQMGWEFTYTTGYVTAAGLERTVANLAALASECPSAEVVVNDWGVLRVLGRDFPSLRPVLGRLLVKQPRLSRYVTERPPVLRTGIQAPLAEIQSRQIAALRETNLGIAAYADLLRRHGVARVDLDPVPQGLAPEALPQGVALSLYAPWTCAAASRTCRTAAVADPRRQTAMPGSPCSGPCREVNRNRVGVACVQPILLRGNSAFVYNLTYVANYLDGSLPVDRLVFEPYIPL